MSVHSIVQKPVSTLKGLGMEDRLNAIGDFIISVGGVQEGDMVADVNGSNGVLAPRLRRLGAQVLKVEGWRSLSQQPLPMASGCLDVLFTTMVLHFMHFPTRAIAEMKRVLRPGGRLVMTDLSKFTGDRMKKDCNARWMGFYTSDIQHWFSNTGFSNIIVNPVPYRLLGFDANHIGTEGDADIFMATGTA